MDPIQSAIESGLISPPVSAEKAATATTAKSSLKSTLSKSEQESIAASASPNLPILSLPAAITSFNAGSLSKEMKIASLSSGSIDQAYQKSNIEDAEKILSSWSKNLEDIKEQIEDEKTKTFSAVVSSFKEVFSHAKVEDKLELPVTLTLLMITPFGTTVTQSKVNSDFDQPLTKTQLANIDPLAEVTKQDLRDYASYLASFLLTYAVQQTTLPLAEATKKAPSAELIATAAQDIAKRILLMTGDASSEALQTPFLPLFLEKLQAQDKESIVTKTKLFLVCTALCLVYTSETQRITAQEFKALTKGEVKLEDTDLQQKLAERYNTLLSSLKEDERESVEQFLFQYVDDHPDFLNLLAPIKTLKSIQELTSAKALLDGFFKV